MTSAGGGQLEGTTQIQTLVKSDAIFSSRPSGLGGCVLPLSRVQLFGTPWTVARQAPLSMGFFKQEYWSGLPFPSPGDLPDLGIKPASFASPALAGRFFTTSTTWEALRRVKTKEPACPGNPKALGSLAELLEQGLDCGQKGWHVHQSVLHWQGWGMGKGRWAMPPLGGDTSWLLCPQGDFVLHRTATLFLWRVNSAHGGYFSPSL